MEEPADTGDVLTVKEAAARLRMHYVTAYGLAKKGTLPGLLPRIDGRHRISRAALERYLNGETGSAA